MTKYRILNTLGMTNPLPSTINLPLLRPIRPALSRHSPEGPLDLFERPTRVVGPESVPEYRDQVGANPVIRREVAMTDPPGRVENLDHVDEPDSAPGSSC